MKAGERHKKLIPRRDERGIALVVALWVTTVLFLLGVAFLSASSLESTIASNEVNSAKAFNIAEAGLELTKRTLKTSTAPSLNGFLSGTVPGPYPFGDTPGAGNSFGGGNYIVRIFDNNDDLDPNNDMDNIVFIESTGSFRNAQRRIVALVQVPLVIAPDGGLEVHSPKGEVEVELEKGAVIDGNDWDPPADPSSCASIAACGTLTTNPAIAGASSNAIENEVEVQAPSTISGSPPTKVNPSLSRDPWDKLVDMLLPKANRNLSVPEKLTGTHTWGTPSAPEITVISGKKIEIENGAVVNGAGLLIMDDIGELELDHGTFNWQGLIIIRGQGELEVEFDNDNDATARIFGAFMLLTQGPDTELELEIENKNSFLKYSTSAINMVRDFVPMTVLSWREVLM